MNTLLSPGQETYMNIRRAPVNGQPGEIVFVVRVSLFTDGVGLVFDRHDILNRGLPVAEGRAYLEFLQAEAAAGTDVWLIIERAGMWTTAAAIVDDAEQALVEQVNATMDAATPTGIDVSDILADIAAKAPNEDWRYQTRKRVVEAAQQQQVRRDFTRTRVHCQPLTAAELDLIRNHRNGRVTTKRGQSWTVLRAIVRRGYGEPVYGRGTRIIAVQLNQRGLNAAQTVSERAA